MEDIRQALKERILVLDGAMGTVLQARGLQGNGEAFNLTSPETIGEIHDEYIEAGADIITANSFSANRIAQYKLGMAERAADMAEAAARIARKAADQAPRKVWVAGSIGPTGKSLSLAQSIGDPAYRPYSFDEMADAYQEQIRALLSGGVDILLFETCFDALNTKAALYALSRHLSQSRTSSGGGADSRTPGSAGWQFPSWNRAASDWPAIMVSVSLGDRSARTLTGQTVEAFYRSVRHCNPLSFGLNCSLGPKDMAPLVDDVSEFADCAVSCHPNAGLPDAMGVYNESPEEFAEVLRGMALRGSVNIVGGCCGTTPEHIAVLSAAIGDLAPRPLPVCPEMGRTSGQDGAPPCQTSPANEEKPLYVSGLESVEIDRKNNFTNVGERTNVAGSRKFARLIAAGDYETALQIAAEQIGNGAKVIDINMDDAMLDSRLEMETFLRHVANDPAVAKAAIMVDSSHWKTLTTGLKNAQGRCIVNSISLKEGEGEFLRKALEINALGAAIIVIAFDEEGQATTYGRKVGICRRAYSLLTEKGGLSPDGIIFDANVLPVGTGIPEHARHGTDFIEAVRWIKRNLPGCRTSGGISNLSFAFRGNNTVREAMHSVFLYHAIEAGLDMGIVNPGMLKVYDQIEPELLRCVEDVILDSDPGATDRLIAYAKSLPAQGATGGAEASLPSVPRTQGKTVEERLMDALVKGEGKGLEGDIMECLEKYGQPVAVIDGPLMGGMAKVGELFEAGKMFLPQVLKSARTMKEAVAMLQPFIEGNTTETSGRPKALFATVKGDVHDIGKNITGIVFGCNGFDIVDLGVMVPKETILERAGEEGAAIIGVSGLITPSLYQMEELCKEMAARGMDTPLMVGGAAASALHTAVKLAPLYGHVFYGADASASAVLASKLVSDREDTERAEHGKQEHLREMYAGSQRKAGAAKALDPYPAESFIKGQPFTDVRARELAIGEVEEYFDWSLFAAIWGIKGDRGRMELRKLRADALRELDRLKAEDGCRITISARFDAAHCEGDDIVAQGFRLPMFRQAGGRSLADFVAPGKYGFDSPMGMFAISVREGHPKDVMPGPGTHPQASRTPGSEAGRPTEEADGQGYGAMLSRAVRLTLAEAASSWLDHFVHGQLPVGSGAKLIKPAAGYASCPDHTLKRDILRLLPGAPELGITLLDSCAMIPDASICGLIFMHPDAAYPEIRHLDGSAIDEYAARRGMGQEERDRFLGHLL